MKIPPFFRHKKLRAATARRASAASAGMDFGDIPEPSMKLSRALLIVLLLHVVAVTGIIAFNAIKTHQASLPTTSATAPTTIGVAETKPQTSAAVASVPKTTKPQPKVIDSGKTYVVAKGDNPVTIAKK